MPIQGKAKNYTVIEKVDKLLVYVLVCHIILGLIPYGLESL